LILTVKIFDSETVRRIAREAIKTFVLVELLRLTYLMQFFAVTQFGVILLKAFGHESVVI
jgi:hypothetical protein